MNVNEIIKGPILTEKSYQLMSAGVYSFKVSPKTNRSETKKLLNTFLMSKSIKLIFLPSQKRKKSRKIKRFYYQIQKSACEIKTRLYN